jgi:hypothetical protein
VKKDEVLDYWWRSRAQGVPLSVFAVWKGKKKYILHKDEQLFFGSGIISGSLSVIFGHRHLLYFRVLIIWRIDHSMISFLGARKTLFVWKKRGNLDRVLVEQLVSIAVMRSIFRQGRSLFCYWIIYLYFIFQFIFFYTVQDISFKYEAGQWWAHAGESTPMHANLPDAKITGALPTFSLLHS